MSERLAGTRIADRYELLEVLGEGGYGTVWRAVETNVNRPVAIKFLKAGMLDDEARRRFRREAKALGRLQHPGSVTLIDFGDDDGLYLVTEFLDGEELGDWLRSARRAFGELITVATQILDVLGHAHTQHIVHRDLKTANIIVTTARNGEPRAKVLDFGISSIMGSKRGSITKTGDVFGTPGYMSPEQLRGEEVGPASDLYAFGAILFLMLEGKPVFEHETSVELMMKHMTVQAPLIAESYGPQLQSVVAKLLAKEPGARFRSALQAKTALQSAAQMASAPAGFGRAGHMTPVPGGHFQTPGVGPHTPRPGHGLGPATAIPAELPPGRASNAKLLVVAAVLIVTVVAGLVAVMVYSRSQSNTPVVVRLPEPVEARQRTAAPKAVVDEATPIEEPAEPSACEREHEPGLVELVPGTSKTLVYVPTSYTPGRKHHTVIMFHDRDQPPQDLFENSGFQQFADEHSWVVLLPFAPSRTLRLPFGNQTYQSPWEDDDDSEQAWSTAYDQDLRSKFCLSGEVHVWGHGAGGAAARRVGRFELTKVWAASAWRRKESKKVRQEAERPHLLIAPTQDGRNPVNGGSGCVSFGADPVRSLRKHIIDEREVAKCGRKIKAPSYPDGKCEAWECEHPFVVCSVDGGRPFKGQPHRVHECEGPASEFPYAQAVAEFFAKHMSDPQTTPDPHRPQNADAGVDGE